MGLIGRTQDSGQALKVGVDLLVVQAVGQQCAAGQDQRAFGFGQHLGELLQVLGARAGDHARAGLVEFGVGGFVEDIFGQDNGDRAGGAGFGDVEGAGDGLRGLFGFVDLDYGLGDIGEQFRVVLFLQCQAAEVFALDLADHHDHGGRVMECRMQ